MAPSDRDGSAQATFNYKFTALPVPLPQHCDNQQSSPTQRISFVAMASQAVSMRKRLEYPHQYPPFELTTQNSFPGLQGQQARRKPGNLQAQGTIGFPSPYLPPCCPQFRSTDATPIALLRVQGRKVEARRVHAVLQGRRPCCRLQVHHRPVQELHGWLRLPALRCTTPRHDNTWRSRWTRVAEGPAVLPREQCIPPQKKAYRSCIDSRRGTCIDLAFMISRI